MNEPILGTIFMFGGNFAPKGYAMCQGQLLPIGQNTALFSGHWHNLRGRR